MPHTAAAARAGTCDCTRVQTCCRMLFRLRSESDSPDNWFGLGLQLMKEKSIILLIGGVLIFGGVWLFRNDVTSLLNWSGGSASGQQSTASLRSVPEHQPSAAKPKKSYHPASLNRPTSSAAERSAD